MPSGQLTVWNGESFALSTDCGVCAARAVDQACSLSEYLPSVKRSRETSQIAVVGRYCGGLPMQTEFRAIIQSEYGAPLRKCMFRPIAHIQPATFGLFGTVPPC